MGSIAELLPALNSPVHCTHLYTWVERGTLRVKCLAHEHSGMSPARARTQTVRSGVDGTNYEATTAPRLKDNNPYPWYDDIRLAKLTISFGLKLKIIIFNMNVFPEQQGWKQKFEKNSRKRGLLWILRKWRWRVIILLRHVLLYSI